MKPFPALVLSAGLILATINVQAGTTGPAPAQPMSTTQAQVEK